MTFAELAKAFREHNKENNIKSQFGDEQPLIGVIVYAQSNFDKEYSVESRSYMVRSDNKLFISCMLGNSMYGDALDGSESGIRLDLTGWKIENCYLTTEHKEVK